MRKSFQKKKKKKKKESEGNEPDGNESRRDEMVTKPSVPFPIDVAEGNFYYTLPK